MARLPWLPPPPPQHAPGPGFWMRAGPPPGPSRSSIKDGNFIQMLTDYNLASSFCE